MQDKLNTSVSVYILNARAIENSIRSFERKFHNMKIKREERKLGYITECNAILNMYNFVFVREKYTYFRFIKVY